MLAADCEKAWIHRGWEDTMQKWYEWLNGMKKRMRKKRWRKCIRERVKHTIKSAEGSAGLLHKVTKPTSWRGGTQVSEKDEEDARLVDRCEAKRKEWAKHWQCGESVQNMENKPWSREVQVNSKGIRMGYGEEKEITLN